MTEKTKVTMIQSADGQTRRVRIGETEIAVVNAAPIPGVGCMNFTMTLKDVEVAFEAEAQDADKA
jgi:hypothetical protein